jgi:glycosyltransferase involved in cell wall biosynthesis
MAALCSRAGSARPRLLITAHGADLQGLDFPLARWLKRWTLRHADAITVVSRALADRVAALLDCAEKLTVLPMGVDLTTAFVPAAPRPADRTLVFAGRLVEKKGLQQLLAAMPKVLEHFPDCRLLVAGDGPLGAALQEQARQLGIDGQVDFLGRYRNDQLPAILGSASLAVFPFQVAAGGDQEGLGLVAIEAMGCGLPVVVSDVPAVHDVVTHQATGLIAKPGDSDDLAKQILRLLEDPALAVQLADAGRRQAVSRFDWRAVAQAYAQLLSP